MTRLQADPDALAAPLHHLDIGVTGHRSNHPIFSANQAQIEQILADLLARIDGIIEGLRASIAPCTIATPRLHSLLAYGADLMSVKLALARNWDIVAPLPFGLALNVAVNAQPVTSDDMAALLNEVAVADPEVAARAADIRDAANRSILFELAEQDAFIEQQFNKHLVEPDNQEARSSFQTLISERAAVAARVMVEQSDIVIGIWDGVTHGALGGTRHSIAAALDQGVPVIWVDARRPEDWRIMTLPESLATPLAINNSNRDAQLVGLIEQALNPQGARWSDTYAQERWRPRSNPLLQAYRRIEILFGGPIGRWFKSLTQSYESPAEIAEGNGKALLDAARALPGVDQRMVESIANEVMRPFAWADGVSTYLSDAFRGSMVTSFILSALAVIGGISYMPFISVDQKWGFAAFEFLLLVAIVGITYFGRKRRWHGRWFETRRVAEYFRHAPILLLLGVARSVGRWPGGPGGGWPEHFAIQALGNPGLPQMKVTPAYLRAVLLLMRDQHVVPQREYHRGKALKLKRVQHNLDRLSERFFVAAVVSVAAYLCIVVGSALALLPSQWPHDVAKLFTFLGVVFPTLGGAFAGIRYFGDFERFASISDITASKLDHVATRADILLTAPDDQITYARISNLAHAIDEIVVTEIENWQSVFGGKNISVPV
jgi:hypothetical protein